MEPMCLRVHLLQEDYNVQVIYDVTHRQRPRDPDPGLQGGQVPGHRSRNQLVPVQAVSSKDQVCQRLHRASSQVCHPMQHA